MDLSSLTFRNERKHPPLLVEALLVLVSFGFATLLFLRPIWDIDIFWHIAAGRHIATEGALPTTDVFGFEPDRPWVPFQWGYELVVHWLYEATGFVGLRVLHTSALCIAFALLWRTWRRTLGPGTAAVLWFLTLLLYQDRINVRPDVFNLLGLALLLPWFLGDWRHLPAGGQGLPPADRATAVQTLRSLLALVPVMAVWASFHAGGCLNHLVAASAIPIGAGLTHLRAKTPASGADLRRAFLFWGVITLPCLLVPNFVSGSLHALFLVQSTGSVVGEWSAPVAYLLGSDSQPVGRLLAGALPYALLLALLYLAVRRRLALDLVETGLVLAFLGLSLLFARFVYFAAPVLALLLLPHGRPNQSQRWGWSAAGSLILAGLIWNTNVTELHGGATPFLAATREPLDARRYPIEAADYLEAAGFRGRVFAHARYGSYLLFRLHPAVHVVIDGRLNVDPSVADAIQYVHEHHAMQSTDSEVSSRIERIYSGSTADALVLESPGFAEARPDCTAWSQVFRTRTQEVWMRPDVARAMGIPISPCGVSGASGPAHFETTQFAHSVFDVLRR